MKIDEIVYQSIYAFPGSNYKNSWTESRRSVLRHLFTVLGNGIKFEKNKKGVFVIKNRYPLPKGRQKEIRAKILAEEPLYIIKETEKREAFMGATIYPSLKNSENDVKVFQSEFIQNPNNYLEVYTELAAGQELPEKCYEVFPPKFSSGVVERLMMGMGGSGYKPYPFCFFYLNFVEINPHYSKYDYESIRDMTAEELRESKNLIPADYSAAIVETYQEALDFFENDEKWKNDKYFSWSPDAAWKKKFDEAAKTPETFEKFHKGYGLSFENYSIEEFVATIQDKSRNHYIEDCRKIIAAFS